ncbi:MAG TPA: hypothetical protein VFB12_14865 [Ktedonobacteraceae bacterium]|nr:hypothetical protein [Ktedonobacteraceae bacterium]
MRPGEEEWWRQCTLEDALRADLGHWMSCEARGMYVRDPSEETTPTGHALRWSVTEQGWVGETENGTIVFVPESVYKKHLRCYLAERGIAQRDWTQIMRPYELEWQRQCEAEEAFQENLEQWFDNHFLGVKVERIQFAIGA